MFPILFIIDAVIQIIGELAGNKLLADIAKVLLMPLLMLWAFTSVKEKQKILFLLLGLFFSWGGDIFLMLIKRTNESDARTFFILGLASFLIAHINYIIHFLYELKSNFQKGFVCKYPFALLPYIIFLIIILNYLDDGISEVKIPVYLYCIVISLMSVAALNRKNIVNNISFVCVFSGSLLFIMSDSMIAVNVFKHPILASHVLIMSTYIIAQYLIVKGCLLDIHQEK